MSIFQELIEVYKNNESNVGIFDTRGRTLLPIAHTSVKVDLEVSITEDGKFSNMQDLGKGKELTVIPATIESANRSSNIAPFPLQDKIKYVAGDFAQYATRKKDIDSASEYYEAYLEQLNAWADQAETPKEIKIIAHYLNKGTLSKDLIQSGLALKDLTGGAFVRFKVNLAPLEPWRNPKIFKSWTDFYLEKLKSSSVEDIDYITGEKVITTKSVEKNINPITSGAKLISANDSGNYTYRGTFLADEFYSVGYESSQEMTHALKWLVQKQGIPVDTRNFLFWKAQNNESLSGAINGFTGFQNKGLFARLNDSKSKDTGFEIAQNYRKAMYGYIADLDNRAQVNVMFLDAATTGRMSVAYYDLMNSADLKDNLMRWYDQCAVMIYTKDGLQPRTPSLKNVIESAYLFGPGGSRYQSLSKRAMTRLLMATINGRDVPEDIIKAIMNRVRKPMSYTNETRFKMSGLTIWRQDLRTLCALQNYNRRSGKIMSLDPNLKDRSYLFGRMLAVADSMESTVMYKQRAAGSDTTDRPTTAMRFFSNFVEKPGTTWLRIYLSVQRSYGQKLNGASRTYFEKKMAEINELMAPEMMNDKPLNSLVFSGFMGQKTENMRKNSDKDVKDND